MPHGDMSRGAMPHGEMSRGAMPHGEMSFSEKSYLLHACSQASLVQTTELRKPFLLNQVVNFSDR